MRICLVSEAALKSCRLPAFQFRCRYSLRIKSLATIQNHHGLRMTRFEIGLCLQCHQRVSFDGPSLIFLTSLLQSISPEGGNPLFRALARIGGVYAMRKILLN